VEVQRSVELHHRSPTRGLRIEELALADRVVPDRAVGHVGVAEPDAEAERDPQQPRDRDDVRVSHEREVVLALPGVGLRGLDSHDSPILQHAAEVIIPDTEHEPSAVPVAEVVAQLEARVDVGGCAVRLEGRPDAELDLEVAATRTGATNRVILSRVAVVLVLPVGAVLTTADVAVADRDGQAVPLTEGEGDRRPDRGAEGDRVREVDPLEAVPLVPEDHLLPSGQHDGLLGGVGRGDRALADAGGGAAHRRPLSVFAVVVKDHVRAGRREHGAEAAAVLGRDRGARLRRDDLDVRPGAARARRLRLLPEGEVSGNERSDDGESLERRDGTHVSTLLDAMRVAE